MMNECYDCGALFREFGECPNCGSANVSIDDNSWEDEEDFDEEEEVIEKDEDEILEMLAEDEDDEYFDDEYDD